MLYFSCENVTLSKGKQITTSFVYEPLISFGTTAKFHFRFQGESLSLNINQVENFLRTLIWPVRKTSIFAKKVVQAKTEQKKTESIFAKKVVEEKTKKIHLKRVCVPDSNKFKVFYSLLLKFNLQKAYCFVQQHVVVDIHREISSLLLNQDDQIFTRLLRTLQIEENSDICKNMEDVIVSARRYFPKISSRLQEKVPISITTSPQSLTKDQQQVLKQIVKLTDHYMVLAAPGAGKTYTMLNCYKFLFSQKKKIIILAYNNGLIASLDNEYKIVDPNSKELLRDKDGMTKTFDSLGWHIWTKLLGQNPNLPEGNGAYCRALKKSGFTLMNVRFNYDMIFIDEIQDLNEDHLYLLRIIIEKCPAIKLFAFGDYRQCLYSQDACVDEIQSLVPWKLLKIRETYRCNNRICTFANTIFNTTDWKNVSKKFSNSAHLFLDHMQPFHHSENNNSKLSYKLIKERRITLSSDFFNVIASHIATKLEHDPNSVIFILTPALHDGKSKILVDALASKLMATFGPFSTVIKRSNSEKHIQRNIEIMTINASKGLTCDHVILLHCFSTETPCFFTNYNLESNIKFFVAVTRARHSVLFIDMEIQEYSTGMVVFQAPNIFDEDTKVRAVESLNPLQETTQSVSVTKLIKNISYDKEKWTPTWLEGTKQNDQVLIEFQPEESHLFDHPFNRESVLITTDLEIWLTYGTFLENVLTFHYFEKDFIIPLFVTNNENRRNISQAVLKRYRNLTGTAFTSEIPIISLTSLEDVLNKNETIQKCREENDGSLGSIWNITRAIAELNTSYHEIYDRTTKEITPSNESNADFKDYFLKNFAEMMLYLKSKVADFDSVQTQVSFTPFFFDGDNIKFNLVGIADVVIFGEKSAIIIDIKCLSNENNFRDINNDGYLQLQLYSKLLKEQFPNITDVKLYLFSCLSGILYHLISSKKRNFDEINCDDEEGFENFLMEQQQQEQEEYLNSI